MLAAIKTFEIHPGVFNIRLRGLNTIFSLFLAITHENGVRKIIKNPNVRKICQDSDILTKIIKLNVDLVGSFISQHFNYCISIG